MISLDLDLECNCFLKCLHVNSIYFLDASRREKNKCYGLTGRNIWCFEGVGQTREHQLTREVPQLIGIG